jgi:hypothetical protein
MLVILKRLFSNYTCHTRGGLHFVLPIVLGLAAFKHVDQDNAGRNIGAERGP